ncbi:MAG: ROK family protein [Planctomycetes bacterium]|nr:ROK family protein [Planctomycetota bacterium]
MSEYFLGIDFGGTNIEIGLMNATGVIVSRLTEPTLVNLGPRPMIERIAHACIRVLSQPNVPKDRVKAVGIASPGQLSFDQGKIIKSPNLPGFDDFPLRAEISHKLQLPSFLENDANAACWAEFWKGAGRNVDNMIMVTMGTGIGTAIISHGELLHSSDGNAAEFGHMIVQPGGRQCTCGQLGCLEAYTSANATVCRANEALDEGRTSNMHQTREENGSLTCKDVFDHAIAGDRLAGEIVDGSARFLAQALVNMRHLTESQMVVFGGGMMKTGHFLITRIRRFYEEMIWSLKPEPLDICLAQLGADAGLIGAAGLALQAWQQKKLCPVGC